MQVELKGVHYDISNGVKEHIDKKMHRLDFADDLVTDLAFTLTRQKRSYMVETNTIYRWGLSHHLKVEKEGLIEGIDIMFDKLSQKIHKEKEKIQDHHKTKP